MASATQYTQFLLIKNSDSRPPRIREYMDFVYNVSGEEGTHSQAVITETPVGIAMRQILVPGPPSLSDSYLFD